VGAGDVTQRTSARRGKRGGVEREASRVAAPPSLLARVSVLGLLLGLLH
jgi:hypothetical protein